jgi:hypothetical protein
MRRPHALVTTFTLAALATAGCGESPVQVDAGPSTLDAPDPAVDAARMPDAAEPADAFRGPDAPAPRCEGAGCEIVELALAFETSCARRGNGEVWCWGRGQSGELGDGGSRHLPGCPRVGGSERTDCSDTAVQVALPEPATRIYAQGGFDVCAESADGEFYCWGSRGYMINGAMEGDRLRPELTPTYQGARSFANAFVSTCWLDASGAPSCIGDNSVGQLAIGDFMFRIDPVRPLLQTADGTEPLTGLVEIASSTTFGGTVCARSADRLYCWGQNDQGQMGDSAEHTTCVSGIDEFDCSPHAIALDFADAARITRISMGSQHTCALLDDGTAWCWGQNRNGELALGTATMQDTTERLVPTEVPNLTDVAEIHLGARHSCARRNDGTVWCWGSNDLGQLGDGMVDHPEAQCMNGTSLIDCSSIPVQVMGIEDAVGLDVGRQHSCAIRMGGTVWCWGNNDAYEVGAGTRQPIFAPQQMTAL